MKVSYHKSGQQHVKRGEGPPIVPPLQLDPVSQLFTEEQPWSMSFENFSTLLPYKGEPADDIFPIALPPLPYVDAITFAQVAIGRKFVSQQWVTDGAEQEVLEQRVFSLPSSENGLQVCVRVLRLKDSTNKNLASL